MAPNWCDGGILDVLSFHIALLPASVPGTMDGLSYDDVFTRAQARQSGFLEVPMDGARILLLPEGQNQARSLLGAWRAVLA